MDWYGSNTVAEKKAPEYPFKMSTWAKIKKNYSDDNSDQMSQKNVEIIYTTKTNFGSYSTFKQFSSYFSQRVAMNSNYSSL